MVIQKDQYQVPCLKEYHSCLIIFDFNKLILYFLALNFLLLRILFSPSRIFIGQDHHYVQRYLFFLSIFELPSSNFNLPLLLFNIILISFFLITNSFLSITLILNSSILKTFVNQSIRLIQDQNFINLLFLDLIFSYF